MGGFGSGAKASHRTTAEAYRLNLRRFVADVERREREYGQGMNAGFADAERPGGRLSVFIELGLADMVADVVYTDPRSRREACATVELVAEPCHFGGRRWSARCPRCERTVTVLYVLPGEGVSCRRCAGLVYPTTRMGEPQRLMSRARKLRRRIGAPPAELFPFALSPLPAKPRGAWWKRFVEIEHEIAWRERRAIQLVADEVERLERRLHQLMTKARH